MLPVRVLGDHLQGIFNFRKNQIVDWERDVKNNFSEVGELNIPWNNAGNPDLGKWVSVLRQTILDNNGISLTNLPNSVRWINPNFPNDVINECFSVFKRINANECVVIIGLADQPPRTYSIASKLRGLYGVVEPLESKDLKKIIGELTDNCAYKKSDCVIGYSGTLLFRHYQIESEARIQCFGEKTATQ